MQEVKGNIAERVASAFNDRDPRMKRWACMSAERRRQYVLRWERRLQAIRDAGFEVVEAAEIERLAMDAKSLEGIIDSLERRMDGPDGLLAKVERLTRERDEARAEVERLTGKLKLVADALNDTISKYHEVGDQNDRLDAENERLREALHRISLASQNSMSSKDECGRIARETLEAKP